MWPRTEGFWPIPNRRLSMLRLDKADARGHPTTAAVPAAKTLTPSWKA